MIHLFFTLFTMIPMSLTQPLINQWVAMPLSANNLPMVDISAKGQNQLWALDSNLTINNYDFANGAWKVIPSPDNKINVYGDNYYTTSPLLKIAASPDGFTIVSVNTTGQRYGYQLTNKSPTQMWTGALYGWSGIQANALNKTHHLAVDPGTGLYMCTMTNTDTSTVSIVGTGRVGVLFASIGDGNERWYVDTTNNIWRSNSSTLTDGSFTKMPLPPVPGGAPIAVDVQCWNRVVLTTACGKVFLWTNDHWVKIPHMSDAKLATIDYNYVYAITYDNKTLQYTTDPSYACPSTNVPPCATTSAAGKK